LLAALKSKDQDVSENATESLAKMGAKAVPSLEQFLQDEKNESYKLRAVAALIEINPDHPAIVPTLLKIAKGRSLFDSEDSLMSRRRAGMGLARTPSGIRALIPLFKDHDSFVRRSAAFAFDDPTEVLAGLSKERQAAIGEAIPALVEALDDKDTVVREVSCEVLGQTFRSKVEPLSSTVGNLLKAKGKWRRDDCLCECD
jgi:HEAT repeat protein